MQKKTLEKLEYNLILDLLQNYSKTYIGKKHCNELIPSNNIDKINLNLSQTDMALSMIIQNGLPPIDPIPNIEVWIKRLEGNIELPAKGLLEIASILKLSRELKQYFNNANYNLISEYFLNLYINPEIEKEIYGKIIDENTIADNASKKLSSIRKSQKNISFIEIEMFF